MDLSKVSADEEDDGKKDEIEKRKTPRKEQHENDGADKREEVSGRETSGGD